MPIPTKLLETIRSKLPEEHRHLITPELFDPFYETIKSSYNSKPGWFNKNKNPNAASSVDKVAAETGSTARNIVKSFTSSPVKNSTAKLIDSVAKYATSDVESKIMSSFPKSVIAQFERGEITSAQAIKSLNKFLTMWRKYKVKVAKPFRKAMSSLIANVSKLVGSAGAGAAGTAAIVELPKVVNGDNQNKKKKNNKKKPSGGSSGGNNFVSGGNF